jgi:hypothetical protein
VRAGYDYPQRLLRLSVAPNRIIRSA